MRKDGGSRTWLLCTCMVAGGLASDGGRASAQVLDPCPALADPLFQVRPGRISCPLLEDSQEADSVPSLSQGRAFLYSALLPGLGQRKMGKGRWIVYVAVEGIAWIGYGHAKWSASDDKDQYRDLAWDIARTFEGPRVDGDFRYYESMEKFEISGAFDTDPTTSGVQPQMDPSTYNGRTWSLATEIHFPAGADPGPGDPEYEAALEDYRARGYDARFEWTWDGQATHWTDYMELIDSSDQYSRRASQFLGVVVANHLLSGIDAFLTARLRTSDRSRTEAQIRLTPRDDRNGLDLVLQVRH